MTAKQAKKQRDDPQEIRRDAFYSISELASRLNCHRFKIDRWRNDGVVLPNGERIFLPYISEGKGGEVRFWGRSVLEFMKRIQREGPDETS